MKIFKKSLSFLLVITFILNVISVNSYASNQYDDDDKTRIESMEHNNLTSGTETILVAGETVKYTYGENFILVDDGNETTIVTEDNNNIYVNGEKIEQIDEVVNIPTNSSKTNMLATSGSWKYSGTTKGSIDVGKLALNVAIAVIAFKTKLPVNTVKRVIGFTLSTSLIYNKLPSIYWVSWIKNTYYKNIYQSRPDMKMVTRYYKGKYYNQYIGKTTTYGGI